MSGTYIINPTLGILAFDTVTMFGFQPSARVTEHPLEDGSVVADHAQANPLPIFISGLISRSPILTSPNSTKVDPVREAVNFLNGSVGSPLIVITPKDGTFRNMLLVRWPHSTDRVKRKLFEVELIQVQFATVGVVAVAASASSGMQPAQELGDMATTEVSSASPAAGSVNSLLSILGGANR